jgi:hypothetical protein
MNTRKYSNKQETHIAKTLNSHKQANSGATLFRKGDVAGDNFLIECKTAVKEQKSFTIQKEWITKNEEEAFAMGKLHSFVAFNFGGLGNNDNFYIINEKEFKNYIALLKEQEEI